MKYLRLSLLVLLFLVVGCTDLPQSGQFQADCTYTLSNDNSVVLACKPLTPLPVTILPTNTVAPPESTPTATTVPPSPTPIPPTPSPSGNLLANGGFEGDWRPVIFPEINTLYGWQPYYCAEPYTASRCVVPVEWNPPWNPFYFKRPEFKPAQPYVGAPYENRVHSGNNAQAFFAFYGIMDAGVYQVIATVPGVEYVVTVYVQLWSAEDIAGGCLQKDATGTCILFGPAATSDIATGDDRRGIWAYVAIDPTGGTNVYASTVRRSPHFGYTDGLYDAYVMISDTFVAESNQATIYLGCGNRWAKPFNDCYIDDAAVVEKE